MENEPVITNSADSQTPVVAPAPLPEAKPNRHPGMVVLASLVVVAMVIVSAVTIMALRNSSTLNQTSQAPTPTVTAVPTVDETSNASIDKDLNQTTISDPKVDVDQLNSDINQL